jgi:hypothetical protein
VSPLAFVFVVPDRLKTVLSNRRFAFATVLLHVELCSAEVTVVGRFQFGWVGSVGFDRSFLLVTVLLDVSMETAEVADTLGLGGRAVPISCSVLALVVARLFSRVGTQISAVVW